MANDELIVVDSQPRIYPMYLEESAAPFVSTFEALYRHYLALSKRVPARAFWESNQVDTGRLVDLIM